jgi:hypothetical protein
MAYPKGNWWYRWYRRAKKQEKKQAKFHMIVSQSQQHQLATPEPESGFQLQSWPLSGWFGHQHATVSYLVTSCNPSLEMGHVNFLCFIIYHRYIIRINVDHVYVTKLMCKIEISD